MHKRDGLRVRRRQARPAAPRTTGFKISSHWLSCYVNKAASREAMCSLPTTA